MKRYYIHNSHLISGRQVNRVIILRVGSDDSARERFTNKRKSNPSIQEAGLYRAKDGVCISEYIGYI